MGFERVQGECDSCFARLTHPSIPLYGNLRSIIIIDESGVDVSRFERKVFRERQTLRYLDRKISDAGNRTDQRHQGMDLGIAAEDGGAHQQVHIAHHEDAHHDEGERRARPPAENEA